MYLYLCLYVWICLNTKFFCGKINLKSVNVETENTSANGHKWKPSEYREQDFARTLYGQHLIGGGHSNVVHVETTSQKVQSVIRCVCLSVRLSDFSEFNLNDKVTQNVIFIKFSGAKRGKLSQCSFCSNRNMSDLSLCVFSYNKKHTKYLEAKKNIWKLSKYT